VDVVRAGASVVLADVRGANRIDILFVGPGSAWSSCTAVPTTDGQFQFSSGGSASNDMLVFASLLPGEVRLGAYGSEGAQSADGLTAVTTTSATGRVGAGVAGVDLLLASGLHVQASTANGWFAAWWPTGDRIVRIQAVGENGQPIGPPTTAWLLH
jgi:hypothetical protein